MLQEMPIIHPKTQQDGVATQSIPQKTSEATSRLLEGAPCSAYTSRMIPCRQTIVPS